MPASSGCLEAKVSSVRGRRDAEADAVELTERRKKAKAMFFVHLIPPPSLAWLRFVLKIYLQLSSSSCVTLFLTCFLHPSVCLYLSNHLSIGHFICPSIHPSFDRLICIFIFLSIHLPIYLPIRLSICLFLFYQFTPLFIHFSICLSLRQPQSPVSQFN